MYISIYIYTLLKLSLTITYFISVTYLNVCSPSLPTFLPPSILLDPSGHHTIFTLKSSMENYYLHSRYVYVYILLSTLEVCISICVIQWWYTAKLSQSFCMNECICMYAWISDKLCVIIVVSLCMTHRSQRPKKLTKLQGRVECIAFDGRYR